MPEFGRLEYLTPAGWVVGHASIALQDPRRYVDQLGKIRVSGGVERGGVVARFVPVDGEWRDGEPVLPTDGAPEPHQVPRGRVPAGLPVRECSVCDGAHNTEWECIL